MTFVENQVSDVSRKMIKHRLEDRHDDEDDSKLENQNPQAKLHKRDIGIQERLMQANIKI